MGRIDPRLKLYIRSGYKTSGLDLADDCFLDLTYFFPMKFDFYESWSKLLVSQRMVFPNKFQANMFPELYSKTNIDIKMSRMYAANLILSYFTVVIYFDLYSSLVIAYVL